MQQQPQNSHPHVTIEMANQNLSSGAVIEQSGQPAYVQAQSASQPQYPIVKIIPISTRYPQPQAQYSAYPH